MLPDGRAATAPQAPVRPGPSAGRRRLRAVATTLAVGTLALGLAGCGVGRPAPYDATGIDTLAVPTPRPEPADFGAPVGNDAFPTRVGQRWTYAVTDDGGRTGVLTRSVAERSPAQVAGVDVAWVESRLVATAQSGQERGEPVAWRDAYATDTAGNVWWVASQGPEGEFSAGDPDGDRAGLVMPGALRVGDSFAHARLEGAEEGWSRVQSTAARVVVGRELRDDVVELAGSDDEGFGAAARTVGLLAADNDMSADADEARRWYAPGLGLVREERADGTQLRLTDPVE